MPSAKALTTRVAIAEMRPAHRLPNAACDHSWLPPCAAQLQLDQLRTNVAADKLASTPS